MLWINEQYIGTPGSGLYTQPKLQDNIAMNSTAQPQMTLIPKLLSHKGHGFLAGWAWLERAALAVSVYKRAVSGSLANSPSSPCTTVPGICWPLPGLWPLKAGKLSFSRKSFTHGVHPASWDGVWDTRMWSLTLGLHGPCKIWLFKRHHPGCACPRACLALNFPV